MELSDEIVRRAARYHRGEVEQMLGAFYPQVFRLSHALCGSPAAGDRAVRIVMNRSLHAIAHWKSAMQGANWFLHQTVFVSRTWTRKASSAANADDVLLAPPPPTEPAYSAFIKALRGLPFQQIEAFILTYGEQADPRKLAVAMDCSTEAAANHLAAANRELSAIAGDQFQQCKSRLLAAYTRLSPTEQLTIGDIRRRVAGHLFRRRFGRLLSVVASIGLIAAIAWAVWKIYPMLVY
jgi:DNA-directed RNA polymerase specialized sigma24 family protein